MQWQFVSHALFSVCLLLVLCQVVPLNAAPLPGLLTAEEEGWLQKHPVLRVVVDRDFMPYESLDKDGHYQGIAADYTQLIAERLDVNIEVIPTRSWGDSLVLLKTRKADVAPMLSTTAKRAEYLNFAKPHTDAPLVLVTRSEHSEARNLGDFVGKRLAVVESYGSFSVIQKRYPDITLVPVDTVEQALQTVKKGEAEATAIDRAVAEYYLRLLNHRTLKVMMEVEELNLDRMGYGVRKDWPELIPILNKVLATITLEDHFRVQNKWRNFDAHESHADLILSQDEQVWLEEHPVIRLGVDPDFAPFEWVDEQGVYRGLAADYMALLAERLGMSFRVASNLSWEEATARGRSKQLDIHPLMTPTDKRKKTHLFTQTYVKDSYVIVGRDDETSISSEADLANKKIALVRGYSATELLLKNQPNVIPVYVETELESLLAVVDGQAQATAGHLGTLAKKIRLNHLANLTVVARTKFETKGMGIAVRDDWPMLRDLLDRAMDSITQQEHREINQRWIQMPEPESRSSLHALLTAEEQQWLAEHPLIRVANDSNSAPLEFMDAHGELQGVSRDYLDKMEAMLDVHFEPAKNLTWAQMLEKVKNRELDMFPSLRVSPERQAFFNFTDDYISMPIMIFAGGDINYIGGLDQLKGRRVSVIEGYATHELLASNHPGVELVVTQSIEHALRLLAEGEVDAFVGNIITTTHYLNKLGLSQIKVVGETPYRYDQSMAVRKDWPLLISILDKALKALSQEEHNAIQQRWMPVTFEYEADYSWLWKPFSAIALIIVIMVYWNRRLAREVEARKETELALKVQQNRLDEVFKVTPSGIWDWDMVPDVAVCSPAYFHMLGYQPEEFPVHNSHTVWLDLMHPDDLERVLEKYDQMADCDEIVSQEFRMRCKDDNYIWVLDQGQVIARDAAGNATRMIGTHVDIEAFKQLELALKAQQQRLDDVFKVTPSGIWDWDLVTDDVFCSPSYFQMLGYGPEGFPVNNSHTTWLDLMHPDDMEAALALYDKAVTNTEPFSHEYRMRCKDGHYKWVLDRGQVVERELTGKASRMIGALVDIDAFKTLENQLRDAKEGAEAANLAKSVFLANMSHELRTPLNAVLGFSELMAHETTATSAQKENLHMINSSGQHLLNLINDVLDMSKIEAGHATLEPQATDLYRLLHDVSSMMKGRAMNKGLYFNVERHEDVPQFVKIDGGKVKQILINLLGNAIKFTETGGVILRVNAEPSEPANWQLFFEIKDTGIGIAEDKIAQIFEPFIQANEGSNGQNGTGLGLAISRQFVALMGGQLSVNSVLDKGSLFQFDMPVERAEVSQQVEIEAMDLIVALAEGEPEWRILIVEDEENNCVLLRRQLEGLGFSVREAINGQEGIGEFLRWQPHLIWMDMHMPVMDGYEATRRIRQLPGGKDVKIIALTATAFKEQASHILSVGCNDLLYKPYAEQDIFSAMAKFLPLHYVYETQEVQRDTDVMSGPKLESQDFQRLDNEALLQLLGAAKVGDIAEMLSLTASLSEENSALKAKLQRYINEFQLQSLIQVLEDMLAQQHAVE